MQACTATTKDPVVLLLCLKTASKCVWEPVEDQLLAVAARPAESRPAIAPPDWRD